MKVWELMAELSKVPAGLDVQVSVRGSSETTLIDALWDDDGVYLKGGDADLLSDDGDSFGTVHEAAEMAVLKLGPND